MSQTHITGTAFAIAQQGDQQAYADQGTEIRITPVSVTGAAMWSLSRYVSVGANGAVDFYVERGSEVNIKANILGFNGANGANVAIPDQASYAFESLVAITVTPATFGNPMTAPGDLIVGGVAGAATRKAKGDDGQVLGVVDGGLDWIDPIAADSIDWADIESKPSSFSPSPHASTHASAGSDALTLSESQVTGLVDDLAAKVPSVRTVNGHALSADVTVTKSDIGLGNVSNAAQLVAASDLSDVPTPATARANLGLVIGTNVLAPNGSGASLTGIPEGGLNLSDLTTNNASAARHGFLPKLSGNSGDVLHGDGAWAAASGGGTAAGDDSQVQFNDASAFGGDAGLTYNKTTKKVSIDAAANDTWLSLKYGSEFIKFGNNGAGYGMFSGAVYGNSNGYGIGTTPKLYSSNTWVIGTTDSDRITGSNAENTAPTMTFNAAGLTDKPSLRINQSPGATAEPFAIYLNSVLAYRLLPTGQAEIAPVAFASLPASPAAGTIAAVSDSNTVTWGATIAGGGSNQVLAFFNGSAWTVIGK